MVWENQTENLAEWARKKATLVIVTHDRFPVRGGRLAVEAESINPRILITDSIFLDGLSFCK